MAANKRISNSELAFLENTIAGAIRINQITALAAELTNDLEILKLLDDISSTAERIRNRSIDWMSQQKEKSCHNK